MVFQRALWNCLFTWSTLLSWFKGPVALGVGSDIYKFIWRKFQDTSKRIIGLGRYNQGACPFFPAVTQALNNIWIKRNYLFNQDAFENLSLKCWLSHTRIVCHSVPGPIYLVNSISHFRIPFAPPDVWNIYLHDGSLTGCQKSPSWWSLDCNHPWWDSFTVIIHSDWPSIM